MGSHGLLLRALQGSVCVYEQIALQGLIHTPHTWVEHKSTVIRPSFVAIDFYYFFGYAVVCDGFGACFHPWYQFVYFVQYRCVNQSKF